MAIMDDFPDNALVIWQRRRNIIATLDNLSLPQIQGQQNIDIRLQC